MRLGTNRAINGVRFRCWPLFFRPETVSYVCLIAPLIVVSFDTSGKDTLGAFSVNSSVQVLPPGGRQFVAAKVSLNQVWNVVY